jgi:hypothetical protein
MIKLKKEAVNEMERVRVFIMEGKISRTVGLNTSKQLSNEELRKLVDLIEDILADNFPEAEVIESPSVGRIRQ